MNDRNNQKVKDVGVDDKDHLVIDLLNGLRLSGPMHTRPVHRNPVMPATAAKPASATESHVRSIVT